jgi:hypothetical protein
MTQASGLCLRAHRDAFRSAASALRQNTRQWLKPWA